MRAFFVCSAKSSTCIFSTLTLLLLGPLTLHDRAHAQAAEQRIVPTPRPLITEAIDETRLTLLRGNTHRLARPEFDLGTAPANEPMERMLLVLKRSPEQETALRKMLDDQQDRKSPSFHKWLSPSEFGQQFGPTDADMQTITSWLQSHGFQVGTTKGRTVLEFSGSASQVQEAFHTTIHKYIVNGEQHWANAQDPSIPAALTPAVAGVLTLHNFIKKPMLHVSEKPVPVTLKMAVGAKKPDLTFSTGTHGLGPYDYATIYNSPGLSENFGGSGSTIGIVGRSNLYYGNDRPGDDIQGFRWNFLPAFSTTSFNIILNGPDPGDLGGGEEAEATLDTTWSGAVAPWANIDLVVSASTNTTDGIDLSEIFIIENNIADIMSESFGSCEAFATSTDSVGLSLLAEQAAAQGITYFVSTGDNGAAGCDDPNSETVATGPTSVNVLASTAFNVAVGGTVFNEGGQTSTYWSGTNDSNGESALSYIPENVWNDSCASCSDPNIVAGSGGESIYVPQPSWQFGVTGLPTPSGGARYLPDVSLSAASHDPYILCLEGSCPFSGQVYVYFAWGTSASAPAFAGIMALIDSQPSGTVRQGAANYLLYRLAASENSTLGQCNASNTSSLPASTCIFHDVTIGDNSVPGELTYGLPNANYEAGVGYDLATGLGSVNVANLINQWNSATFSPTTTDLVLNGGSPVNVAHGQPVPVSITVTPNSGTGTTTGDAVLLADTGPLGSPSGRSALNLFTLAGGNASGSTSILPGGQYDVTAHYGGDITYAPSSSAGVTVTVSPEPSSTTFTALPYGANGNELSGTNWPYGTFVYLRSDVAGESGQGVPSGTVSFNDTFGTIPGGSTFALNGEGNSANPNGVSSFDTGTHTVSASYSGDSSFNASTSTPQTFTITAGFFAVISGAQSNVVVSAPGGSGTSSVSIANSTGFSGMIALACSGLPSEAACVFSPSSITANGTASTTSATITVTTTAAVARAESPQRLNWPAQWVLGAGLFASVLLVAGKRRGRGLCLLLLLTLILITPSCGGSSNSGGSGNTGPPPNPGTPAGTYPVTVTATSGTTVSTTGFTLIVQ